MQGSESSFCWGQVAGSVGMFPAGEGKVCLQERFGLFAKPVAICLGDDVNFAPAKEVFMSTGMQSIQVSDAEALLKAIEATTPYQPVICFIDFTFLKETPVETLCNLLASHLSYSIVMVGQYNFPGWQGNRPHPSLPLQSMLLPFSSPAVQAKIDEFLIQASQLAKHLVKMRNIDKLDEREKILVQLVSFGMPNKKSANVLGLAEKTVEKCRTGIYRKLGVRSTGELASLITMSNFYRWPVGVDYPSRNRG